MYYILTQQQGSELKIINIFTGSIDVSKEAELGLIKCKNLIDLSRKAKKINPEWEKEFRINFMKQKSK